nr:NADH dehydrogenase subunit 5 [Baetis sp. PC-2010]
MIFYTRPTICNFISMLLGAMSGVFLMNGCKHLISGTTEILDFNILTINSLEFNFIMIMDFAAFTFMGVVTLIASCVVFYSKDYMGNDPNIERFIWLVFMFVMSMMALIISPNMISILLGWDGLGLVSYALVIYYQNVKSFNAGMVTALSNRIGDVMILMSIALMSSLGSFNFSHMNLFSDPLWQGVVVMVVIAACTKSAQIPFSAWLPAAMAAPTPVSALVHSSTLVTAGVYLLIRFNEPMKVWGINKPLMMVSILTMLMAGIGANLETDLKKIIALSTLSQLGLMMMSISMGAVGLAYFHMLSHALFKALLFMCAGNVIHCSGDTQDLRKMGFIASQMPITCVCINTANLALCGAPFMAGFYSKDLVLETLLHGPTPHLALTLAMLATALTVTYSLRLSFYCMMTNISGKTTFNLNDSAGYSCMAMMPLTLLSVTGGLIMSWMIFPTPSLIMLPAGAKTLILPVLALGVMISLCLWAARTSYTVTAAPGVGSHMMGSMWFMPTLVTRGFGYKTIDLGFSATYSLDRGWVELLSVKWLVANMAQQSSELQSQQNNYLKTFMLTFLIWFTGVLIISI